jgi:membrane protease YdiL (CAAX protease family)
VIVANAAVGRSWSNLASDILAGVTAGLTFLIGALDFAGAGILSAGPGRQSLDAALMVTALIAATLASRPVRQRLARIMPIDPDSPVHAFALVLTVLLFGMQLSQFLFVDVFAATGKLSPLTPIDIAVQEAPFLILAAAGVGLFMRRNVVQAASRLGLTTPRWWHLALAFAAAGAFFGFSLVMDYLSQNLTPGVARQITATTQHLFGGLDNPVGIAALAIAPGICEEILFRGALQPKLGILPTALLFTSIHTQYGFSLDAFTVFLFALGLGAVRKYTNTTTSSLCHVSYNLLAAIGIGAELTGAAVAVEAVLIALVAYGIWSMRRKSTTEVIP